MEGRAVQQLAPGARALLDALPADAQRDTTWFSQAMNAQCVANLLSATARIDAALSGRAAEHVLAWPWTYDLDAIVLPAVHLLNAMPQLRQLGAVGRLREACLGHLRARIAQPLAAPRDWTRDAMLTCTCKTCSELRRFLASADQQTWRLKAAESLRSHVEGPIRHAQCDVDATTDKSSRPYALVLTKKQASHDRRAQQRKNDLRAVARLEQ